MTPKEKAIELVSRFLTYSNQFYDNDIRDAKQCAIILVDEILNILPLANRDFWQEVKKEIEKL